MDKIQGNYFFKVTCSALRSGIVALALVGTWGSGIKKKISWKFQWASEVLRSQTTLTNLLFVADINLLIISTCHFPIAAREALGVIERQLVQLFLYTNWQMSTVVTEKKNCGKCDTSRFPVTPRTSQLLLETGKSNTFNQPETRKRWEQMLIGWEWGEMTKPGKWKSEGGWRKRGLVSIRWGCLRSF